MYSKSKQSTESKVRKHARERRLKERHTLFLAFHFQAISLPFGTFQRHSGREERKETLHTKIFKP